ncbi:MAG: hypothetical protein KDE46_17665 [Caldilineaceae bacterium]|nr:hypothetical protein [Caldilineaceae bacterium]
MKKAKKSKAKEYVAGVRLHENERDALRNYQQSQGARTMSDALRQLLHSTGVFNGQVQSVNTTV